MGSAAEAGAVLDPQLRVRGLRGLRVADASAMPTAVAGDPFAATVVLAEKAAALVRSERVDRLRERLARL